MCNIAEDRLEDNLIIEEDFIQADFDKERRAIEAEMGPLERLRPIDGGSHEFGGADSRYCTVWLPFRREVGRVPAYDVRAGGSE